MQGLRGGLGPKPRRLTPKARNPINIGSLAVAYTIYLRVPYYDYSIIVIKASVCISTLSASRTR